MFDGTKIGEDTESGRKTDRKMRQIEGRQRREGSDEERWCPLVWLTHSSGHLDTAAVKDTCQTGHSLHLMFRMKCLHFLWLIHYFCLSLITVCLCSSVSLPASHILYHISPSLSPFNVFGLKTPCICSKAVSRWTLCQTLVVWSNSLGHFCTLRHCWALTMKGHPLWRTHTHTISIGGPRTADKREDPGR